MRISETLLNEIIDYCEWAGIRLRDYFIEQSCCYIFKNDDDWRKYKEQQLSKEEIGKEEN